MWGDAPIDTCPELALQPRTKLLQYFFVMPTDLTKFWLAASARMFQGTAVTRAFSKSIFRSKQIYFLKLHLLRSERAVQMLITVLWAMHREFVGVAVPLIISEATAAAEFLDFLQTQQQQQPTLATHGSTVSQSQDPRQVHVHNSKPNHHNAVLLNLYHSLSSHAPGR